MSSQSWFVEGLRKLAGSIKEIEYYQTGSKYAIWQAMNQEGNPLAAKDHPDVKAWRQFNGDIVIELNAAVKIGLEQYGADLACCRKLSVELSQGFYKDGSSTTFEAIVEVVALADKLEFCSTSNETQVVAKPLAPLHPYKAFFVEFKAKHPKCRYPEAAAAKEYWNTRLSKAEIQTRCEGRSRKEAMESFVRSFKYVLAKPK